MDLNKTPIIPSELNAEILAALLSEYADDFTIKHEGVFYRNYQGDVLSVNLKNKTMSVSRDSLYHLLPQALFHRIDLFRGITGKDFQDKFKDKWEEQKKEKEIVQNFFMPFDNALFSLKSDFQSNLNKFLSQDSFLTELILEKEHEEMEDIKNPYIRQLLFFLPYVESFRGNKSKLKLILHWIFGDNIQFETHCFTKSYKNEDSNEYDCILQETSSKDLFCDDEYDDSCFLFLLKIQRDIEKIDNNIYVQEQELEEFRVFFHHYFMPVFEEFEIHLGDFEKKPVLDDTSPVFLEYNTQI